MRAAAWQPLLLADVAVLAMVGLLLPIGVAVAYGALVLVGLASRGCYQPRFTGQLGSVVSRLLTTVAVVAVVLGAITDADTSVALLRASLVVTVALIAGRAIAGAAVKSIRSGMAGEPTLIVGAGVIGANLAESLRRHPEYGLTPIGVIDDVVDEDLTLPLLGGSNDLTDVVTRFDIRHIVIAFGRAQEGPMVDILRACDNLDAEVWVVPRLFELGASADAADQLWGLPVVRLPRRALRTWQWRMKRMFDIPVSAVLLAVVAPVLAAIAIAVRIGSPGPVLFRQRRMGQRERPFDMLKFRTLRCADEHAVQTWSPVDGSSTAIQAARQRDVSSRQTRIGNFLRHTSIDELPQLWNVLRGDLSLVGPRPEEVGFAIQFGDTVPGYRARHRVPAGVTGLAQVNGLRGDTSIEDRARLDNVYIDTWSFWGDIVILARTVGAIIRPHSAGHPDAIVEPTIDLTGVTDLTGVVDLTLAETTEARLTR